MVSKVRVILEMEVHYNFLAKYLINKLLVPRG